MQTNSDADIGSWTFEIKASVSDKFHSFTLSKPWSLTVASNLTTTINIGAPYFTKDIATYI